MQRLDQAQPDSCVLRTLLMQEIFHIDTFRPLHLLLRIVIRFVPIVPVSSLLPHETFFPYTCGPK